MASINSQPKPTSAPTVNTAPKSEIVFKRQDAARFVMLNRPTHLNALNTNMINLMTPQIQVPFVYSMLRSGSIESFSSIFQFCDVGMGTN